MTKSKVVQQTRIDGVIIGVLTALDTDGEPLVAYPGNRSELPIVAKSTIQVTSDAIGREVALLFEGGDVTKPIIMGLIHKVSLTSQTETSAPKTPESKATDKSVSMWLPEQENSDLMVDGKRIQLRAKEEIVLKCGKSSITMTRAGKVIIRGAYISTRSSGANRIKGGSVQIN